MSVLEIDRVSKVFGPNPALALRMLEAGRSKADILKETKHVVGLSNVSLNIEEGEVFVIMGLSGSGKSTLIRHLNRLIEPSAGQIRLHGADIVAASPSELQHIRQYKMAMVFQRFGLMPHRTVHSNVAYGLEVRGEPKEKREAEARRWIDRVGLSGFENSYPSQLSGGMQQRVGLVRALATNPEVLLMDEAFSALDPLIRHDMQQVLLELQRELRKTIVFITHDLDEALAIGDRIAMLQDGELVQCGRPAEIILQPATDYVRRFVGNVNRLRALRVRDVMSMSPCRSTNTVRELDTLQVALAALGGSNGPLQVQNSAGEPVGELSLSALARAISGENRH